MNGMSLHPYPKGAPVGRQISIVAASIWMIALNTLLPLVGPPCPSRLLPKFAAQKEHELWSFQSIPLLINSINLKRDGVRICSGKMWEGEVLKALLQYSVIVSISCQLHWVIELQRRPAHAKPDFNWLSGPRNGTWKRTCGISCLCSLAPMRRLQCSTTQATFTNPSLLRGMF